MIMSHFLWYRDPSANRNVTVALFVPEQRSAFLVGANKDVGTLSRGTLNRRSRIVDTYQPSYEPNENTLRRIVKIEEVEPDEDAPVNPTYIDDDLDDEFDDYWWHWTDHYTTVYYMIGVISHWHWSDRVVAVLQLMFVLFSLFLSIRNF